MNMTYDEMIAVIQAHRDGKEIEYRSAIQPKWTKCMLGPVWNFEDTEYRIKPEPPKPREWWAVPIAEDKDGDMLYSLRQFDKTAMWLQPIHVREVLPSTGEQA